MITRRLFRRERQRRRRVHVPTVLQMEAVECGAASLAMVLGYYGRIVPLEELRLACGVSRDGTKASNIVKAARRVWLQRQGLHEGAGAAARAAAAADRLLELQPFRGRGRLWQGPRLPERPGRRAARGPQEEFDQSFTGVVLVFEPGPDFKSGGAAAQPGRRAAAAAGGLGSRAGVTWSWPAWRWWCPAWSSRPFTRVFVDSYLVKGMTAGSCRC